MALGSGRDAPEEALLARTRAGDEGAFEALFERHRTVLEGRIRRILPPPVRRKVSVADVLQETRIVAFAGAAGFVPEGEGALRGWLLAIATNKAREARRRHGAARRDVAREVSHDGSRSGPAPVSPVRSPSEDASAAETAEIVRRALGGLPPDYAEVLRLTRIEGLTLAEAATRMGRSREAVKKLAGRALARFARVVAEGTPEPPRG
jgi:RNA polymerase sigma-70 factor (ECF subfamily)